MTNKLERLIHQQCIALAASVSVGYWLHSLSAHRETGMECSGSGDPRPWSRDHKTANIAVNIYGK